MVMLPARLYEACTSLQAIFFVARDHTHPMISILDLERSLFSTEDSRVQGPGPGLGLELELEFEIGPGFALSLRVY